MRLKEFYIFLKRNRITLEHKSLAILSAPYIMMELMSKGFYSIYILIVVAVLLVLDILIKNRYHFLLIALYLYFLYVYFIYVDTLDVVHSLPFSKFSVVALLMLTLASYFFYRKKKAVKAFNIFMLIFAATFIFNAVNAKKFDQDSILAKINSKSTAPLFSNVAENDKPILLLVMDELASSGEIYKHTKDSIEFDFDKKIEVMGFNVYDGFKSASIQTKYSLPSIFNFNLHNSEYTRQKEEENKTIKYSEEYNYLFENSLLVDSLMTKGVTSHSFGLIKFNQSPTNRLNNYIWNDRFDDLALFSSGEFLNRFFAKSLFGYISVRFNRASFREIFSHIFQKEGGLAYLKNPLGTVDAFRKEVMTNLRDFSPKPDNFYYFHLYFPHSPYTYFGEFNYSEDAKEIDVYVEYRRFVLGKILSVIDNPKFSDCRIIIVGDHGFREDSSIDPKITSLYTKGFNNIEFESNFVVQDIGYLIQQSFK